jgi:glutamine---fructose-6-phosphate transaminase (isomerizing)
VYIITDNPMLARGIDADPIIIPSNGPLTALIAVLPLQVAYLLIPYFLLLIYAFF